jgi:hypothetical protein
MRLIFQKFALDATYFSNARVSSGVDSYCRIVPMPGVTKIDFIVLSSSRWWTRARKVPRPQ